MIPHHQQAIQMAEMARTTAAHRELKALADEIIVSQGTEITRMQGWLREWGEPVPTTMGGAGHGQMGQGGMGMMSQAERTS